AAVHARRSGRCERRWWAVRAGGPRSTARRAAPSAPRRLDRTKPRKALGAEGPRPRATARTRPGEQRVEHGGHHRDATGEDRHASVSGPPSLRQRHLDRGLTLDLDGERPVRPERWIRGQDTPARLLVEVLLEHRVPASVDRQ